MGPADGRTGTDDVIDDGDSFVPEERPEGVGDSVREGEDTFGGGPWRSLRVGEGQAEVGCDHEGNERAFDKGAANSLDVVGLERGGELDGELADRFRAQAEQFQVEPQTSVVARLEEEMPTAGRHQTAKVVLRAVYVSLLPAECSKFREASRRAYRARKSQDGAGAELHERDRRQRMDRQPGSLRYGWT